MRPVWPRNDAQAIVRAEPDRLCEEASDRRNQPRLWAIQQNWVEMRMVLVRVNSDWNPWGKEQQLLIVSSRLFDSQDCTRHDQAILLGGVERNHFFHCQLRSSSKSHLQKRRNQSSLDQPVWDLWLAFKEMWPRFEYFLAFLEDNRLLLGQVQATVHWESVPWVSAGATYQDKRKYRKWRSQAQRGQWAKPRYLYSNSPRYGRAIWRWDRKNNKADFFDQSSLLLWESAVPLWVYLDSKQDFEADSRCYSIASKLFQQIWQ